MLGEQALGGLEDARPVAGGIVGRAVADLAVTLGEPFAEALALDQVVSSERTQRALGWVPTRADAVTDLMAGSYAPVGVTV